jgi:DNA repair/transcription protein MET18/MMS19
MKEAAIDGIVEISHQKPQLVVNSAFPAFLGKLPDKDNNGPGTYLSTLEAFAKLGSEPRVFETVILRLKNKFNSAVTEGASNVYLQAILSALLYAFSSSEENEVHVDYLAHFRNLVIPLLRQICTKLDSSQQDDTIFYLSGRLANTVLRQLSPDAQKDFTCQIYTLFLERPQKEAPPFTLQTTTEDGRRIIISTYMLGAVDRNLSLPFEIRDIVSCCSQFALQEGHTVGTRIATLQQISLVLNKFVNIADIQTVLNPVLHHPMNLLQAENLNSISIRVVFAMFKGLMLRNSAAISEIYPQLLNALSDPTNGRNVAYGFSTLLQPDEVLTKANHCIVSALHKQKIFSILVPPLSTGFRQADATSKPNYLVALSGILRWIPYDVLEPQLQSLNPLLLQTLDVQSEDEVKAGTIDTLISILNSNPKAIEEHCGSLISRLLSASAGKSNPPNVCIKALQCLSLVAVQQRTEIVVPFRKSVVKKLVAALDAGKRSVRAEAVRCRSKWLELDEAGDDEE